MAKSKTMRVPADPWMAFAFLVGKCAEGFGRELMEKGKSEAQARNTVIGCFLQMAAGEACRVARREGRKPSRLKWRKATDDAFQRAVIYTKQKKAPAKTAHPSTERGVSGP